MLKNVEKIEAKKQMLRAEASESARFFRSCEQLRINFSLRKKWPEKARNVQYSV
jgi:hypothetical protein